MIHTRGRLRKQSYIKWRPIWLVHTLDIPCLTDEFGHHDGELAFASPSAAEAAVAYAMDESFMYGGILSNHTRFYLCDTAKAAEKLTSLLRPDTYRMIRFPNMYGLCAYDPNILECLHSYFLPDEVESMEKMTLS